jgi:uncharacterized RDD family membrane protein YckC
MDAVSFVVAIVWVVLALICYLCMYNEVRSTLGKWTQGDRVTALFLAGVFPLIVIQMYFWRWFWRQMIKLVSLEYWGKPASW